MAPLRQKLVLDASLHELIQREATPSARPSAAFGRHRVHEGFQAFPKLLPVGLPGVAALLLLLLKVDEESLLVPALVVGGSLLAGVPGRLVG